MLITSEQLHEMIPHSTDKLILRYLTPLNKAMEKFQIDTPLRIAAFIAQVAHESCSLIYSEEIASGSAYEKRGDLGNLLHEALEVAHANHSTTGRFYKGRGLLQITGYSNYLSCSKGIDIDCVTNPRILSEPEYAAKSAAWFWNIHNLNILADVEMFDKITHVINGGYNGKAERDTNYRCCKEVLGCNAKK